MTEQNHIHKGNIIKKVLAVLTVGILLGTTATNVNAKLPDSIDIQYVKDLQEYANLLKKEV